MHDMRKYPLSSRGFPPIFSINEFNAFLGHEDLAMFGTNKDKTLTRWIPGTQAARDRWGNPIGPTVRSREFGNAAADAREALNRTRWSQGLL